MHVVIYEDIRWRTFAPLSLSRPIFMLGTGTATLLEKQIRHTNPSRLTLWVRPQMADFVRERVLPKLNLPAQVNVPLDNEPALLFSGCTLHFRKYRPPEGEAAVVDDGDVLRAARVHSPGLGPEDAMSLTDRWMRLMQLPRIDPQTRLIERIWDLIKWNEESLIEDFTHLKPQPRPRGAYHVIEEDAVWIGEQAQIGPGAVLDASKGPIIIAHDAVIGPNAVLQGPCYIGPYSQVLPLAQIRPGTSVGILCKVGGEVSNSIILGYSNKSHEGFLGDSYLGKWVNLGAGTTTSNLKNTYGEISMRTNAGEVKTGRRFLGSLIGDHVKTAIGTRLMAGTYVGFCSMLALSGFAPRFVRSFTFHTDRGAEPYHLDKAIEVMKTVFARRDRAWTDLDNSIVRYVSETALSAEG